MHNIITVKLHFVSVKINNYRQFVGDNYRQFVGDGQL